jgi:DNA-binding NtrC family response regulator
LFGHVKGAFTGASGAALGCFRAAEGGTIFLDEVGELDLELQSKLLRVIQERQVMPVGSHEPIPIDVRVISATNRDLQREVAAGRFRLDLYYRLDVLSIDSAPLRSRFEDIEPLARHFIEQMAADRGMPRKQLTPAALRLMQAYDWPGNVRQLQNVLERAVVLCESAAIGPEWIPRIDDTAMPKPGHTAADAAAIAELAEESDGCDVLADSSDEGSSGEWQSMAENEREHLRRTLEHTQYNQSAAARLLGIDYRLLLRRMKKYGLKASRTQTAATRPK